MGALCFLGVLALLCAWIPRPTLQPPSVPGTPFQLKPAGTLCRQAAGDCDLPEFCNGTSPDCPPDTHLLDGSPCASGHGYCWDGACPTLEQQCQQLWGAGETVRAEPGDPLGSAQLPTGSGGELGGGRLHWQEMMGLHQEE